MNADWVDENTYIVELYDSLDGDDYCAGYLKRSDKDEDSDEYYWRFYPNNNLSPINAGDLKRLAEFMCGLNINLQRA